MKDLDRQTSWLREQRQRRGWTAADVARIAVDEAASAGFELKLTQQAVSAFENGNLKSVPRWLRWVRQAVGDIAAQTSEPVHHVTMRVALPSEAALARMFEGLLASLDLTRPNHEIAQLLARRLPIGFEQLQHLLPEPGPAEETARGEAVPTRATDRLESPPVSRT